MTKLRHKQTNILMIIGMCLSFLLLINGKFFINKMSDELNHKKNDKYTYIHNFSLTYKGNNVTYSDDNLLADFNYTDCITDIQKLFERMKKIKYGNIYINIYLPIGNTSEYVDTDIILKENEDEIYTLQEGKLQFDNSNGNYAIISPTLLDFCETKDGKQYLKIYDNYYYVSGILKDYSALKNTKKIVLNYDNLADDTRELINCNIQDSLLPLERQQFTMQGNNNNTDESYNMLLKDIQENFDLGLAEEWNYKNIDSNAIYKYMNIIINIILILFSISNCIVISEIWIQKRMYEFSIRKTFGYSRKQTIILIITRLLIIGIISLVLSIIIQVTYASLFAKDTFNLLYFCSDFIFMTLGLMVVVLCSSINPIIKLSKYNAIDALKEL